MPDHAEFLAMICAAPDDDGPRLVYADWLEERGDCDRAEFIRVQIELAHLPADDERRRRLAERQRELLARHETAWTAHLRPFVTGAWFERGFVETVALEAPAFVAHAEAIFRATPVRAVKLLHPDRPLDALADCPHLARVESLALEYVAVARHVEPLFASPHLAAVNRLTLQNQSMASQEIVDMLVGRRLPRLACLDLSGSGLDLQRLGRLAGSWLPGQLTDLVLGHTIVSDTGVARLLEREWPRLHTLSLARAAVADRGAALLARTPHLPALRRLDLGFNQVRAAGARRLAGRKRLDRLDLSGNPLSGRVVSELRRRCGPRLVFDGCWLE